MVHTFVSDIIKISGSNINFKKYMLIGAQSILKLADINKK